MTCVSLSCKISLEIHVTTVFAWQLMLFILSCLLHMYFSFLFFHFVIVSCFLDIFMCTDEKNLNVELNTHCVAYEDIFHITEPIFSECFLTSFLQVRDWSVSVYIKWLFWSFFSLISATCQDILLFVHYYTSYSSSYLIYWALKEIHFTKKSS